MAAPANLPLDHDLAKALSALVAPDEAPYFDEIVASQGQTIDHDHELASGLSIEEIGIASMALLTVAKPLLDFIWENSRDSVGKLIKESSEEIRVAFGKALKAWIANGLKEPLVTSIPAEEIDTEIAKIVKAAKSLGLDDNQSKKFSATVKKILR